jgi:hypothetical protein
MIYCTLLKKLIDTNSTYLCEEKNASTTSSYKPTLKCFRVTSTHIVSHFVYVYSRIQYSTVSYTGLAFYLDAILSSSHCRRGHARSPAPVLLCERKQQHINTVKGKFTAYKRISKLITSQEMLKMSTILQ